MSTAALQIIEANWHNRIEVSPYGSDERAAVQRGFPFKTLTAAKNAAQAGDMIVVSPGTYTDEKNLAKNGVNWFFAPGTTVVYTYSGVIQGGIFDDSVNGANGACSYKVDGYGHFKVAGATGGPVSYVGAVLHVENAGSEVHFTCARMDCDVDSSASMFCVYYKNGVKCIVNADVIASGHNDPGLLEMSCVGWEDGDNFIVRAGIISAKGGLGAGGWCLYANEPVGGRNINAYVFAGLLENTAGPVLYTTANSANYKWWIDCLEARSKYAGLLGENGIQLSGGGKVYFTCQKFDQSAVVAGTNRPMIRMSAGEIWFTAQKATFNTGGNDAANAMFCLVSGGTLHMRVDHYENVGAFDVKAAFEITGGTVHLHGGYCKVLDGLGIVYTGGTCYVRGMQIDTSNVDIAGNRPVSIAAGSLVLSDTVLICGVTNCLECVHAAAAQNARIYGACVVRKAKHVNVTYLVGAETVSANVTL